MRTCSAAFVAVGVVVASAGIARAAGGYLSVKEGRFVDPGGRHVILHGVNIGAKHKKTNYVSWHEPADFARMRAWGFNCVRLLIIWAAIEPECGSYDEDYLRRIDKRIAWAKANGLYVLVDMHQDLWGEKPGGDGAPVWATLDRGRPHRKLGQVWSDAYMVSPMVQTAFDNFWANKPGPDGVGIQDRFALAWQHVARRYADEPAVVGYDILNEPIPGTEMLRVQAKMIPRMAEIMVPDDPSGGLFELATLLKDPDRRGEVFERLADVDVYRSYLAAAEPTFQRFERDKLAPMYRRVAKAIRQVDRRHILFVAPCVSSNQGVGSDLPPVLGPDGKPDPLLAISPHAYDLVTDVRGAGPVDERRTEMIYQRHLSTARRLNAPMLVGEWGAFNVEPKHLEAARINVRQIEATLASDTYWYFNRHLEKRPFFKMLQRPVPSAVAGTILRYRLDPSTGVFECVWKEAPAVKDPSRIYVPANWYPTGVDVTLEPRGGGCRFSPIASGDRNGHLTVAPTGRQVERRLVIRPK